MTTNARDDNLGDAFEIYGGACSISSTVDANCVLGSVAKLHRGIERVLRLRRHCSIDSSSTAPRRGASGHGKL